MDKDTLYVQELSDSRNLIRMQLLDDTVVSWDPVLTDRENLEKGQVLTTRSRVAVDSLAHHTFLSDKELYQLFRGCPWIGMPSAYVHAMLGKPIVVEGDGRIAGVDLVEWVYSIGIEGPIMSLIVNTEKDRVEAIRAP